MLSHIYQIAYYFQRCHGIRANVLYLNHGHFARLRGACADADDIATLMQRIGMQLVLSDSAAVPRLAYLPALAHGPRWNWCERDGGACG